MVLLALLVSFVTSIATGIVTVALMDQAPDPVIQTINRVVERTIEKVVQAPQDSNQKASVITKETIVVKVDDLVMQAVEKNSPNIVRIESIPESGDETGEVVALGVIISGEGRVITSSMFFDSTSTSTEKLNYSARLSNNQIRPISSIYIDKDNSIAILNLEKGEGSLKASKLGNSDSLKLGQTSVVIGGDDSNTVKSGIVASLPMKDVKSVDEKGVETMTKVLSGDVTDTGKDEILGTVLLNLNGEVVGIYNKVGKAFLPINLIKTVLK